VVAWKRVLPRLIGDVATAELFAAADRGELNVVEFNQGAATNLEEWKGDPSIHPLLMQQVEREIADLTFQIDLLNANPEQQSNALRRRAVQKSRAGMDESALSDLNAAIKLVGRQPEVLLEEAAVYSAMQRDDEVEKIFAEVQTTDRGKAQALREQGVFRFGQGRFEEAHALLLEDAKRNPTVPYTTIMAELAARRIGQREFSLLERTRRTVRPASWAGVCLGYLMGSLNEDVLIREAQRGDTLAVAQRLCEAYFILAQVAIASGDQEKGIDWLESCIGTGITGFVEFRLARLELKRVAPEREAKTRRWDDKSPKDRLPPQRLKEKKSIEEELFDEPVPA
jgi:lipoprotein NlpI